MRWALRFGAGLVGTAWVGPLTAAGGTTASLLGLQIVGFQGGPISYGLLVGLGLWLLAGVVYAFWASASRANSRSYGELLNRIQGVRDRLDRICPEVNKHQEGPACRETRRHLDWLDARLDRVGLEWINGNGYLTAWERVHRAEETMILAESSAELLEEALHDKLRLQGANMPNLDRLLAILEAVRVHICKLPKDPCRKPCEDVCVENIEQARAALREVRYSINDFRDSSWNGLLQLRNQTMVTLVLTELAGYMLLVLAVATNTPIPVVIGGVTFFLVGAAVGLFNHLYMQLQSSYTGIEDYGLSTARLLTLPTYSGLAAVGGVLIAAVGAGATPVHLDRVFNIGTNPDSLIVAAVFGIAPGLLVTRLGQSSQRYQKDLQSTEVGSGPGSG